MDLWGSAKGDMYVKDTLSLKSGCAVEGGINVRKLIVELGASFNGTCKMITEEEYDKTVGAQDIVRILDPAGAQEGAKPAKK